MTAMAVSPDDSCLVVGWRSLFLRQYNWTNGRCLRQWKVFIFFHYMHISYLFAVSVYIGILVAFVANIHNTLECNV